MEKRAHRATDPTGVFVSTMRLLLGLVSLFSLAYAGKGVAEGGGLLRSNHRAAYPAALEWLMFFSVLHLKEHLKNQRRRLQKKRKA